MKVKLPGLALFLVLAAMKLSAGDYSVRQLELNHPEGFYESGEEVVIAGQLFKGDVPTAGETLCAVTKWEGREVDRKEILCNGEPFRLTYRSDKPGWVYFGLGANPVGTFVHAFAKLEKHAAVGTVFS